jgi:hypothetical protein
MQIQNLTSTYNLMNGLKFSFKKDVYTPYTTMTATFSYLCITNPKRIRLTIDGVMVHEGIIEHYQYEKNADGQTIKLKSKGYTSLLTQNEATPGLYSNITFNQLMETFLTIPNITHENNSSNSSYVYIEKNTDIWQAIASYCYKVFGRYPYISGTNTVTVTQKANPISFTKTTNEAYGWGMEYDYTNLLSHLHMADINGTYNTYNTADSSATQRNIYRHKHYDLDEQFLDNPATALQYKLKYSRRATQNAYCIYKGYDGEDLNDLFTLTGDGLISNKRISAIEINGDSNNIMTKISAYQDSFNI